MLENGKIIVYPEVQISLIVYPEVLEREGFFSSSIVKQEKYYKVQDYNMPLT